MAATFPYQSSVIASDQELFVTRHLPAGAERGVRIGQRVGPDDVIATIGEHLVAERIDLAARLDVAPGDVAEHLQQPVGSAVRIGDVLAKIRRGLRNRAVISPSAGTIVDLDSVTGELLLAPHGASESRALLHGDIIEVDARTGVMIHTFGTRVVGIAGLGEAVDGRLRWLAREPEQDDGGINASMIAGEIVVAAEPLNAGTIRQLVAAGVAGIVTGGVPPETLATAFDWPDGTSLEPWRHSTTAARPRAPVAIMLTEGFGNLVMNSRIVETLRSLEGKPAALIPETHLAAPLRRPELIVSDPTRLDDDGPANDTSIGPGAHLRFVDPSRLGGEAVALGEPHEQRLIGRPPVITVDVKTPDNERLTVPLRNVELIG